MKVFVRNSIYIGIIAGLVVLLVALRISGKAERDLATCSGKINAEFTDTLHFMGETQLKAILEKDYGNIAGLKLDSLDLSKVEELILKSGVVKSCEAYVTDNGVLNMLVSQRVPVIRFETAEGSFYCDREAAIFQSRGVPYMVPVADGNINLKDKGWVLEMVGLASEIKKTGFWDDALTQIYVEENGDLVMFTRDRDEKFIFGAPVNCADKLNRMTEYLTRIAPLKEDVPYKTVNVKYDRQIICRQ